MKRSSNQLFRCEFQTIYSTVSHMDSKKIKASVNGLRSAFGINLDFIISILPEDQDYLTDKLGIEYRFLAYVGSIAGRKLIFFFMRPENGLLKIGEYLVGNGICVLPQFREDGMFKKRLTQKMLRSVAESLVTRYALNGVENN